MSDTKLNKTCIVQCNKTTSDKQGTFFPTKFNNTRNNDKQTQNIEHQYMYTAVPCDDNNTPTQAFSRLSHTSLSEPYKHLRPSSSPNSKNNTISDETMYNPLSDQTYLRCRKLGLSYEFFASWRV